MILTMMIAIILTVPAIAQDTGVPDTLRFTPSTHVWTIDDPADTLLLLPLIGRTDQSNILGVSLPLVARTNTGGGMGHDDSLIAIDTFSFTAAALAKSFAQAALDASTFPLAQLTDRNGCLVGMINFFPPSFMPPNVATELGQLRVRVLDPTQLPQSFEIEIDTLFFPPAGTFKFSPSGGTGFSPAFTKATITVDNQLGIVTEQPSIVLNPTAFTFDAVQGGANPVDQVLSITNGGTGTLNWSVSDNADWLTLNPLSGSGDGSTTLTVDITGVAAGAYIATVTVTDAAADNSPQTATVTLNVAPPLPHIVLDPTSFTFDAVQGGSNPADQVLDISNSGGGTLNWSVSDNAAWLTLNPLSGSGDGSTTLSVDITGLSAGAFIATVTVTDAAADNSPQTATVTLNVAPPLPHIVLDPTAFTFDAVQGGSNPADQALSITNSGGGSLNWGVSDNADWLTLNPLSGSGDGSTTLTVDITGVAAGAYIATVTVTDAAADNSPQTATVTLNVAPPPPVPHIALSPAAFTFDAVEGGANPADQVLNVTNDGSGTLNWTASDDADWLTLNPLSGSGDGSTTLTVDISVLAAGTYNATVTVTDPAADNSPKSATVTLNVAPPPPVIQLNPTAFTFDAVAGGSNPVDQMLNITNTGGGTLNWTASDDAAWLFLNPTGGVGDAAVTLTVDITAMTAGTYFATVTVSDPSATNDPQTAEVTLNIQEPPSVIHLDPMVFMFSATEGDPNPADQMLNITNLGGGTLNWTASDDAPWLTLNPVSGTGDGMVTLSVDITGLTPDTYVATVSVSDPAATNDPQTASVTLVVNPVAENPEIVLDPSYFSFEMDEGGPNPADQVLHVINDGTGTLSWTAAKDSAWLLLSKVSGTAPDDIVISIDGASLVAGEYQDTIWVSGNAFNSPQAAIVDLVVNEVVIPDEDTVWVGTDSGMPGEAVVVEVNFKNVENLSGITLPIRFDGLAKVVNGLTCDSVNFFGTRVDYIASKVVSIDNVNQTVLVGIIVVQEAMIAPGTGPLAYLHFHIDPAAVPGIVPLDTISFTLPDNELMFADENGDPVYPKFVAGSVEILQPPIPCLNIDPEAFEFTATEGGANPADQYLEITNCGEVSIDWTATVHIGPWLSVLPTSGTDDGTVALMVNVGSLVEGDYYDSITVSGTGVADQHVFVHLAVGAAVPTDIAGTVETEAHDPIDDAVVELWDSYPDGMVLASMMTSGGGNFLFEGYSGSYQLRVHKDGYYPTLLPVAAPDEEVVVTLVSSDDLMPTNEWIDLYCGSATLDGFPILPGDVIEAFDPSGVLCGQFFVDESGHYGFMPVYRDDSLTTPSLDEGCDPGDLVTIKLNGFDVTEYLDVPVEWTQNGDRIEACFDAQSIKTVCIDLYEGWNLISWNVDTESDDIETLIASIVDKVEVILSFEQGGLTYDPDLPQFSTLHTMDHYHGYWFRVSEDVEFCVEGLPVDPSTPIYLEGGWNLASYLPDVNDSTPVALASIYSELIVALGFYGGGVTWDPNNPDFSTLRYLAPEFGYWFKVTEDVTLTYPGAKFATFASTVADNTSAKRATFASVVPTTQWIDLYGEAVTVDGTPIASGAVVEAVDANGRICGAFVVATNGMLGFMPVYGDDATTKNVSEGPAAGGEFHLVINGVETAETFAWSDNGDQVNVGALSSLGGHATIPMTFNLSQNYPNPFNPKTSISYVVADADNVTLTVYNLLGEQVKVLVDGFQAAGEYTVDWNGDDVSGRTVSSGVYFYKLSSGDYAQTKKMMLMK
jgi:hypothetical protein